MADFNVFYPVFPDIYQAPPEGSGGGDVGSPPAVVFVNPPAGTAISATQALTVDVTDPDGGADILLLCVSAAFGTGAEEVVYRNGAFTAQYAASTTTPIANGNRFVISRAGNWPAGVTLSVDVADAGGNLA